MDYPTWIESEAKRHGTDNCTLSLDWNVWCCWEHDLWCIYLVDPREAYELWLLGDEDPWRNSPRRSRRQGDINFWRCNRRRSPTLWGRVRSGARLLGVRIGAIFPG